MPLDKERSKSYVTCQKMSHSGFSACCMTLNGIEKTKWYPGNSSPFSSQIRLMVTTEPILMRKWLQGLKSKSWRHYGYHCQISQLKKSYLARSPQSTPPGSPPLIGLSPALNGINTGNKTQKLSKTTTRSVFESLELNFCLLKFTQCPAWIR